jgi:hypothetical protein
MQGGVVKATARPAADGVYSFANVAAGSGYTVIASLAGYDDNETAPFDVAANVSGKNLTLILTTTPPPPPPPPPGPGEISGTTTLWGSSATFTKVDDTTATLAIDWTGSNSGNLSAITGSVVTDFVAGKNITVTFAKTGGNTGSDRISFGKIAELKTALTTAGAASVAMKSSAESEKAVAPVFNGDDLFTDKDDATGKVFGLYNNNDVIFDGFTIKTSGGLHIECTKKIFVERLKIRGGLLGYLNGFGLKSSPSNIEFTPNAVLTGEKYSGNGTYPITPAYLTSALGNLGINATNIPDTLPTIIAVNLRANATSGSDVNLNSSPVTLAFLEKYMTTDNLAKLNGLNVESSGYGSLFLQKSIPFDGNGIIDPFPDADKVNGNLAVWLASKGVGLGELYITDPTLYDTATTLSGGMRNVVLKGEHWKYITISGGGVIVSVNTPVAGIPSSSNLWYVVQAQSDSSYITEIVTNVLEVKNIADPSMLVPANYFNPLQALITANATVRSAINSNFTPIAKEYTGSSSTTWCDWAEAVKNNTTLPAFE